MIYTLQVFDAAGTTRLGEFHPDEVKDAVIEQEENGSYLLSFETLITSAAYEHISRRKQVWVKEVGSSATPRKFRVVGIGRMRDRDGVRSVPVRCEHITNDLAKEVLPGSPTLYSGAAAEDLVTRILDGSDFTVGSVNAVLGAFQVPEFSVGGTSRLDNLRGLAEVLDAVLVVNDDKSVDLNKRKSLTGTPDLVLHVRKQLLQEEEEEDSGDLVSRMYGFGGGDPRMTLAGTWHPVTTVERDYGGDKAVSALYLGLSDDCYVGTAAYTYYLEFRHEVGVLNEVTDFAAGFGPNGDDDIAYSPAVGHTTPPDVAYFRLWVDKGSGPQLLDWIEDREQYDSIGWVDGFLDEGDLELVDNLINDPFLSRDAFSSGAHPIIKDQTFDYADRSAALTENADLQYIQNGTRSQKVVTDRQGAGVYTAFDFGLADYDTEYFSAKALVYLVSGRITMFAIEGDFTQGIGSAERGRVFPPYTAKEAQIDVSGAGEWHILTLEGLQNTEGDDGALYITQLGDGDSEFYIDSIQVEPSASLSSGWVDITSRHQLWVRVYREMARRRVPSIHHEVKMRDLSAEDSARHPYDSFGVSDVARIIDDELSVDDTAWVKFKKVNLHDPGDTEIRVQTYEEMLEGQSQEAYLLNQVEQYQRKVTSLTNRIRKQRDLFHPMKRAGTYSLSSQANKSGRSYTSFGDDQSQVLKSPFCGEAYHGMPFMERLRVKEGRKVVWLFWPTKSAGGAVRFWQEGMVQDLTPKSPFTFITRRGGFSLQHVGSAEAVTTLTTFITEYNTMNRITLFGTVGPYMDKDNSWMGFIPPGEYKGLTLFAYGETANNQQTYAGNLLLLDVPLLSTSFQTGFGAKNAPNTDGFNIDADAFYSSISRAPGQVPPFGKFTIGEGERQEDINTYMAGVGSPNASFREGNAYHKLGYGHYRGERVVEKREGGAEGPTIEPSSAIRRRLVVSPTVTYA